MTSENDEPKQALYPQEVAVALDEMNYDQNFIAPNQEPAPEVSLEEQELNAKAVRDQHAYEIDLRQHQVERVLIHEESRRSSNEERFDFTGAMMAVLTLTILVGFAYFAQKYVANLSNKPMAQTGVVIEHAARVPVPVPAYPTVLVRYSNDPSQAPSPLPMTVPVER
ncbi:MAG: hypothetical protein WC028_17380 [Candidatus Obscuribacterales bacterium]|jgi:hypothetical protein